MRDGRDPRLAALPSRWVLRFADGAASALYVIDARGRRIAYQNLDVVFGDELDAARRKRIVRSSYREGVRSPAPAALYPLTPEKWHEWVDVAEDAHEDARHPRHARRRRRARLGPRENWELLLGMHVAFPELPNIIFVAETQTRGVAQRVLGATP